ncbi:MAG: FlaD/FlaE family flagellar protein [Methermicoccaceae archaeon]
MKGWLGRLTKGGLKSRFGQIEQAKRKQAQQRDEIEEQYSALSSELSELKRLFEEQERVDTSSEKELKLIKHHITLISNELSKSRSELAAMIKSAESTTQHHESQLKEFTSVMESIFKDMECWKDALKAEIENSVSPPSEMLLDITQLLERSLEMASKNREQIEQIQTIQTVQTLENQSTPSREEPQQKMEDSSSEEPPLPEPPPPSEPPQAYEEAVEEGVSLDELLRKLEPDVLEPSRSATVSPSLDDEVRSLIEELSGQTQEPENTPELMLDVHPEVGVEPQAEPRTFSHGTASQMLTHIRNDIVSQRLCLEWVEFLMERAGRNNLPDLLEYYVELGWISGDVGYELLSYARGIDYFVEKDSWKLSADDHVKSYWFVRKIVGKPIKRSELKMLRKEIESAAERIEQRL